MNRPDRLTLLASTLILAAGCGTPEGQLPTYRTTGKVLLRGQPAVGAYVVLHPQFEYDNDADPPSGGVKEDGTFTLSTYGEGDGAPAGSYKVAILPPANFDEGISLQVREEDGPDPAFEKSQSPETSGIEVTIEERRNDLPAFELE
jgi:hypothetical protein